MGQDMNRKLPRIVIVGAGFGGLNAARSLKKAEAQVTLIDRSNHHLFQPLLYQVATAGLSPADIAVPIRSILRRHKRTEILMSEVVGVDTASRQVLLQDQKVGYDYLVLATGARHSYFGRNEWEQHAPGLKSLNDARTIRERVLSVFECAEKTPDPKVRESLLTFVIVGGGPTGVEMAGSIAELAFAALAKDFRHINPRSTRIILLEAGPRIMASFPEKLSAKAVQQLQELGVEVRTNCRVGQVDEEGVIANGERIEAGAVIWGAGVRASPAGQWLGAESDRAGRVKVNRDLTVPGHPEIYVIGDTAATVDDEGQPVPGVAPAAMQQGKFVAKHIRARLKGGKDLPIFHYRDKGNLATIGRSRAIADLHIIRLSGLIAWWTWLVVHIAYLIGFRNRLLVLIQWAWSYLTFRRGARLITENVVCRPDSSEGGRDEGGRSEEKIA